MPNRKNAGITVPNRDTERIVPFRDAGTTVPNREGGSNQSFGIWDRVDAEANRVRQESKPGASWTEKMGFRHTIQHLPVLLPL